MPMSGFPHSGHELHDISLASVGLDTAIHKYRVDDRPCVKRLHDTGTQ